MNTAALWDSYLDFDVSEWMEQRRSKRGVAKGRSQSAGEWFDRKRKQITDWFCTNRMMKTLAILAAVVAILLVTIFTGALGAFYSWLIGRELPLLEVHLRSPEPASVGVYEELFNCPVRFGQARSGLVIHRSLLQHPVVQTEESLREFGVQAAMALQNVKERQQLVRSREQLTEQVKSGVIRPRRQRLSSAKD